MTCGITVCKEHVWEGVGNCPFCSMIKNVKEITKQLEPKIVYPATIQTNGKYSTKYILGVYDSEEKVLNRFKEFEEKYIKSFGQESFNNAFEFSTWSHQGYAINQDVPMNFEVKEITN